MRLSRIAIFFLQCVYIYIYIYVCIYTHRFSHYDVDASRCGLSSSPRAGV